MPCRLRDRDSCDLVVRLPDGGAAGDAGVLPQGWRQQDAPLLVDLRLEGVPRHQAAQVPSPGVGEGQPLDLGGTTAKLCVC